MNWHATTILAVRRHGKVVLAGDGQVTMGERVVLKSTANKLRRIHHNSVVVGFAGSTADAMTLFETLEVKLEHHNGQLLRAAVELAKDWRTDRTLRRLEALLIAADAQRTLLISGTGDVIEPEEGIVAIGSGGDFALAAARALYRNTDLSARDIAQRAMNIAAEMCVFTNNHLSFEELEAS